MCQQIANALPSFSTTIFAKVKRHFVKEIFPTFILRKISQRLDIMVDQHKEKPLISHPRIYRESLCSIELASSTVPAIIHAGNEPNAYYFHADHLGSTSAITDANGSLTQHVLYFAYGEQFVDEYRNSTNSPYLFNGKEYDTETGRYYYGARYYDPRVSLWIGVDPMAGKYPSISPYIYTAGNPIIFVDPDGMRIWIFGENGERTEYSKGMKYSGDDSFTRQTIRTLNKSQRLGRDKQGIINYYEKNEDENITIIKTEGNGGFMVDASEGTNNSPVSWNPKIGVKNLDGEARYKLSPATVLLHEIGEAYYSSKDPEGKLKDIKQFAKNFKVSDYESFEEGQRAFNIVMDAFDKKMKSEVGDYDTYSDRWIIRNVEPAFLRVSRGTKRSTHKGRFYPVDGGPFSTRLKKK